MNSQLRMERPTEARDAQHQDPTHGMPHLDLPARTARTERTVLGLEDAYSVLESRYAAEGPYSGQHDLGFQQGLRPYFMPVPYDTPSLAVATMAERHAATRLSPGTSDASPGSGEVFTGGGHLNGARLPQLFDERTVTSYPPPGGVRRGRASCGARYKRWLFLGAAAAALGVTLGFYFGVVHRRGASASSGSGISSPGPTASGKAGPLADDSYIAQMNKTFDNCPSRLFYTFAQNTSARLTFYTFNETYILTYPGGRDYLVQNVGAASSTGTLSVSLPSGKGPNWGVGCLYTSEASYQLQLMAHSFTGTWSIGLSNSDPCVTNAGDVVTAGTSCNAVYTISA